jgi:ureidoglycolate hydrolase
VVAACWEFIIPKFGMDIPNIGALSFATVIDRCLHRDLAAANDFSEFMAAIRKETGFQAEEIISGFKNLYMEPSPVQSILMADCLKRARDISKDAKYNDFGLHGTGISTAVDSLAVIKKYIFDTKVVTPQQLITAIDADFEGYGQLQAELRYNQYKMGNDNDGVDAIGCAVLDMFADSLKDKINEKGGVYRPGTGSAMYYIWHIQEIGASPDGRRMGEPLAANFSPGLNTRVNGPVSVIKSFTKPDLKRVINGGPLTLELHDTPCSTTKKECKKWHCWSGHSWKWAVISFNLMRLTGKPCWTPSGDRNCIEFNRTGLGLEWLFCGIGPRILGAYYQTFVISDLGDLLMPGIKVKELTLENFNKFGSFVNMINPDAVKIEALPVEFFRDLIGQNLGRDTRVSFSTCRVTKRPFVVKELEFRTFCQEGILPLDGGILLSLAPATANGDLPWDRIEAFWVSKGTMVTLRPGVWHCGPYAYQADSVNVLIALPERTYANDCRIVSIPANQQSEIELASI